MFRILPWVLAILPLHSYSAAKTVRLTGPELVISGSCSAYDASVDGPASANDEASWKTLSLGTSSGSSLYSDGSCTQATAGVTIAKNASSTRFWLKAMSAGQETITARLPNGKSDAALLVRVVRSAELKWNSEQTVSLGTVVVGKHVSQSLTLNNVGETAASRLTFSVTPGFQMDAAHCGVALAPQTSCDVELAFVAEKVGAQSGVISVGYFDGVSQRQTALTVAAQAVAPGTVDSTFGDSGSAVIEGGSPVAMDRQPDGGLVLVYKLPVATGSWDYLVTRLNSSGQPDPAFGEGGSVRIDLQTNDAPIDLKSLPDGRIVVAGFSAASGLSNYVLIRLKPDGSKDASFGNGGVSTIPNPFFYDFGGLIVIAQDGSVYAGGTGPVLKNVRVVHFRADGSVDTAFGNSGIADSAITYRAVANSIALQADGKILLGGYGGSDYLAMNFLIARFRADGTPDATFGSGGINLVNLSTTDYVSTRAYSQTITTLGDGKILIGGYADSRSNIGFVVFNSLSMNFSAYQDAVIARLTAQGALDPQYGQGGLARLHIDGDGASARSMVSSIDGSVVFLGSIYYPSSGQSQVFASRFDATGALDSGFGEAGKLLLPHLGVMESARNLVGNQTDGYEALIRRDGYGAVWRFQ